MPPRGAASFLCLAVVLAGGLAGSACGNTDPDEEELGREFRRQGQELCREAAREVGPPADGGGRREAAASLREGLAASSRFYRRLDALNAPPELGRLRDEVLELERRDDTVWRRVLRRLESGAGRARAVAPDGAAILRNRERADSLYRRLGLTACTSGALDGTA